MLGSRRDRNRGRAGVTILEMVVSLILLLAAAGVFAQMHWLAARQQRSAEARAVAMQALANWMERCAQVPFDELSEKRLKDLIVTDSLQRRLRGAEVSVAIDDEEEPVASRVVKLTLHWQPMSTTASETAQLVGWHYETPTDEEAAP